MPEISDALLEHFFKDGVGRCVRMGCGVKSATASEATHHLFNCSTLPDEYYQCLDCPFFAVDNEEAVNHSNEVHNDLEQAEGNVMDDYDMSTESDEDGKPSSVPRTRKGSAYESLSIGKLTHCSAEIEYLLTLTVKLFSVGGSYGAS